jgi:DNA topoisomerase-1
MTTYITRKKSGKKFDYFYNDSLISDDQLIERINKLVIPPAWQNVEIAKAKSAKIQARGYDAAGRLQSIYNPSYRLKQEKLKFDRILRFAEQLPSLRRQVDKDLARKRLGKEKVLACVIKLIDEAYFRVGNDRYAKEHQTYGVTTLRSKHANIKSNQVTFDFIGKSGQKHVKTISNPKVARIIKQLDELPGYEIFRYQDEKGTMHDLHASDVNAYIKQHMGEEFTAKDFRTWGGTLLAASAVIKEELSDSQSQTAKKKAVNAIVKRVAKRLGNTPTVARGSYIDPRVLAAVENDSTLIEIRKAITVMKPKKYLSVDEQCVLRMLQK